MAARNDRGRPVTGAPGDIVAHLGDRFTILPTGWKTPTKRCGLPSGLAGFGEIVV